MSLSKQAFEQDREERMEDAWREHTAACNELSANADDMVREQIDCIAVGIVQQVEDYGSLDALEGYMIAKHAIAMFTDVAKQLQDAAIQKSMDWSEKTFQYKGYEVTKTSGRGRWSYPKDWEPYMQAKQAVKDLEQQMQLSAAQPNVRVVTDDGEIVPGAGRSGGGEGISIRKIQ